MHIKFFVGVAGLLLLTSPSHAELVVSSFKATASTNAFAPLDRSAYFDEHVVENLSPAVVNASGDWTGTNFGGTTDTWHWVGEAHATMETMLTQNLLTISGTGSFNFELTTTDDFVNPNMQTLQFGPSSTGNYTCRFSTDAQVPYDLSGTISRYSRIRLFSLSSNMTIYSKTNNNSQPFAVNVSGVLAPGEYTVGADTGSGGAINFGASHISTSGSFSNFLFTVQVPEPAAGMLLLMLLPLMRTRS